MPLAPTRMLVATLLALGLAAPAFADSFASFASSASSAMVLDGTLPVFGTNENSTPPMVSFGV